MSWIGRALSSVSQYYKEINPATLSGAIDVIVVETTAKDGTTQLACSPFHVRYGKLSVLRPVDRKVYIKINDEEAPFHMKVGDTGEAFFVFETDQEVPEHLLTSPLAGPVDDVEADALDNDPEPLDLGDSVATLGPSSSAPQQQLQQKQAPPSTDTDTSDAPFTTEERLQFTANHESNSSKFLQSATRGAQAFGGTVRDLAHANERLEGLAAKRPHLPHQLRRQKTDEEIDSETFSSTALSTKQKKNAITEEAFVAAEYDGVPPEGDASSVQGFDRPLPALQDNVDISPFAAGPSPARVQELQERTQANAEDTEMGSYARTLASESLEKFENSYGRMRISESPMPETPETDSQGQKYPLGESGKTSFEAGLVPPTPSREKESLMLDMDGYKMEDAAKAAASADRVDADGLKTPPIEELRRMVEADEAGHVPQAQEIGVDPDVLALTRALLRYSEAKPETSTPDGRATPSSSTLSSSTIKTEMQEAADPYTFVVLSEGRKHIFELAICDHSSDTVAEETLHDATSPSQDDFTNHRLAKEDFLKAPEKVEDRNLYVRYNDQIFGWDNGSAALASMALYRKALIDRQAKAPVAAPVKQGTWKRWWGGSRSRTITGETNGSATSSVSLVSQPPPSQDNDSNSTLQVHQRMERASSEPPPSFSPPTSPPLPASPTLSQTDTVYEKDTLNGEPSAEQNKHTHYAKTLRLTSDQLKQLNLKKGRNDISFTVQSSFSGVAKITARVFLWDADYRVVISDIDGTITKSDALGHVFTMIGRDWTHPGVAKLYTDIARNGYKMLYLTSRAVGQADVTREYLRGIQQGGYALPEGPVIMSPDRLLTSLHREVVLRKPEVFKMACLRDIKRLFADQNPFYAGFGNRLTDGLSYRSVEIPSSRIFTIDSQGNVKLELLELAGYTSTYIGMTNLVNETFPPVHRSNQPQYNDFNYWRPSLPEVEFPDLSIPTPVSPALSARSDSRMSVFRVGAIAGAITKRASRSQLVSSKPAAKDGTKSPLSSSPPVDSQSGFAERSQNEIDLERNLPSTERTNPRKRNDSMPGSYEDKSYLDKLHESEEFEGDDRENGVEGEDEEDELDENDLEAGDNTMDDDDIPEMDFAKVPYL